MSKACSPDAHCTDIQNMKKMFHLVLQKHAAPSPAPSLMATLPHALCWTSNDVSLEEAAHGCPSDARAAKEQIDA